MVQYVVKDLEIGQPINSASVQKLQKALHAKASGHLRPTRDRDWIDEAANRGGLSLGSDIITMSRKIGEGRPHHSLTFSRYAARPDYAAIGNSHVQRRSRGRRHRPEQDHCASSYSDGPHFGQQDRTR